MPGVGWMGLRVESGGVRLRIGRFSKKSLSPEYILGFLIVPNFIVKEMATYDRMGDAKRT
jgi:hypothetical protein